jgi:glutathione synthase/RimK-type ligase-like ATP-grasp enzyme
LWKKPKHTWKYYYGSIYDPLQRHKLRKKVLPYKYRIIYDDKHLCQKLCEANNIPTPDEHGVVEPDNFHQVIKTLFNLYPNKYFIIKPISGRGGSNIFLAYQKNSQKLVREKGKELLLKDFRLPGKSFIQKFIDQHHDLRPFSKSVNTIRIVTLLTPCNEVLILGALIRFGVAEAFIDNTSQGGVKVGIDLNSGKLNALGCDKSSQLYKNHPSSGIPFKDFQIPFWNEVINLAIKIQKCMPYNLLIGQDIAISTDGPVVVELNAEYDNVGLEQACGPILSNNKVLKAFYDYDLLINKYQKYLAKNLFKK